MQRYSAIEYMAVQEKSNFPSYSLLGTQTGEEQTCHLGFICSLEKKKAQVIAYGALTDMTGIFFSKR